MLEFQNLSIDHKDQVRSLFKISDYPATEYSFTTMYIWRHAYKTELCFYKNMLLVRSWVTEDRNQNPFYLFPVGQGDIKEAIELIAEDAKRVGKQFKMYGILENQKELLEEMFPNRFTYESNRDSFDYIYSANELITLEGKKFQAKRNHANFFRRQDGWSYEEIDESNIEECRIMNRQWCAQNTCPHDYSLQSECCSAKEAIKNLFALDLKGGLIRKDNKVIAYSIGEMLNSDTFLVHIEKAFAEYRGIYPVISQEFLSHNINLGFKFVNREDDAGQEGLRKAKIQNNPILLLKKWIVIE